MSIVLVYLKKKKTSMSGEEPARGGAIADGVREEARDQFMQRGLCRASTSAASKVGSSGKILK